MSPGTGVSNTPPVRSMWCKHVNDPRRPPSFESQDGSESGLAVTALTTDYGFSDSQSLHWSMAIIAVAGGLLSIGLPAVSLRPFRACTATTPTS